MRECVAFLKWWDNPGNSLSGAVFLRAPWMGIDDRDAGSMGEAGSDLAGAIFRVSRSSGGARRCAAS